MEMILGRKRRYLRILPRIIRNHTVVVIYLAYQCGVLFPAFADDKCTVAIDTLLALFALLAESTTDVFSSGISRIVIA